MKVIPHLLAAVLVPLAASSAQPAGWAQDVLPAGPARGGDVADSRPDSVREFLSVAAEIRTKTRTPGAAFVIFQDHRLIHMGAIGLRDVAAELPVTEDTMFAIGSCTKAFTGVLAALAVERGQLEWTDPVAEHLEGFELNDPYLTKHVSLIDLMSHRTGLAGHNRIWYGSEMSLEDLLGVLPHLESYFPLGRQYVYNNALVSIAGLAIASVVETSWHDQIQAEIFTPLGMVSSVTDYAGFLSYSERSTGYAYDGQAVLPHLNVDVVAPAGAIGSTARDMAAWLGWVVGGASADIGSGVQQLLSPDQFEYLTAAHMVVHPPEPAFYGIGWEVEWRRGKKVIGHGGGIDGQNCYVRAVPSEGFGIVILANQQSDFDDLLVDYAEDLFVHGEMERDPAREEALVEFVRVRDERRELAPRIIQAHVAAIAGAEHPRVEDLVGTYVHPAYPPVRISAGEAGVMRLAYNNSEGPIGTDGLDGLVAFIDEGNAGAVFELDPGYDSGGRATTIAIPMERGLSPAVFRRAEPGR